MKYRGAQTSNNAVASSFKTQWYTKFSAFVHFWIFPTTSHLFLNDADFHSLAFEGQRDTNETVGTDSGHINDTETLKKDNRYVVIF